ncbi:MAG: hypothetical protein A3K10_13885 [Bacteroidetes bacterium RIFCSPLOWO2_12_FULL_31_6]|nr:MAG: hypothetical protein A3K10_13885 [Bacteroidetes bacterium RIFCSPLOWO2_12_FULL_31_6]
MKQMVFSRWHFMRWFRLVISLIIIYQAYHTAEYMIGLIGLFFMFQAISGVGCCSTNNYTNSISAKKNIDEIEFEEVKNKTQK